MKKYTFLLLLLSGCSHVPFTPEKPVDPCDPSNFAMDTVGGHIKHQFCLAEQDVSSKLHPTPISSPCDPSNFAMNTIDGRFHQSICKLTRHGVDISVPSPSPTPKPKPKIKIGPCDKLGFFKRQYCKLEEYVKNGQKKVK